MNPDFRRDKLEKDAKKNWDLFYKRNGNRFFKDRHWTLREFEELDKGGKLVILEIGCGVGNFMFPLIQEVPDFFIYGCDFSDEAVRICHQNDLCNSERCKVFVADLTTNIVDKFRENKNSADKIDVATLIFVLSAIHPQKMPKCVQNLFEIVKPGGTILLRDYAVNDHAMKRFSSESCLEPNFFVRQDGTRAYYFSEEFARQLFVEAGFVPISVEMIDRKTVNVKEGVDVDRVFIQGKFRKPDS